MERVAVITGASQGIGRALSLELSKREVFVIAIGRKIDELKKLESLNPDKIQIISSDITTKEGIENIIVRMKDRKIDYLVHSAGIVTPLGLLQNVSKIDLNKIYETNVLSPIYLTQDLIPFFNEHEGRILNITSVAGDQPVSGAGAYCISKAAFNMWTRILQVELPSHIAATDVIPGEVDTGMQKELREAPIEKFPLAAEFTEAYQKKTLISPDVCAEFLADLLLNISFSMFSKKRWNIYQDYKKSLPLPLNKSKQAE